jgi:hypothetical protein
VFLTPKPSTSVSRGWERCSRGNSRASRSPRILTCSTCVYIHANPVKDGLVALPEDWEFSNYLEWMDMRDGKLVNREFIVENFGTPEEYRKLVMEYIKTRYLPDDFWDYLKGVDD